MTGKPPLKHDFSGFFGQGGLWVILQSLLLTLLVAAGPIYGRAAGILNFSAGIGLFVLGGVIGILGVTALGKNRTAFPMPKADTQLVTKGIYGLIRHPLYSCLMIAGFGWALIWSSLPGLVIAAGNLIFFDLKARREEQWLRTQFSDYLTYSKRTKRFLPGIY